MIWRQIDGFEKYEVSDVGEVRRCLPSSIRHPVTGRFLKKSLDVSTGYQKIGLYDADGRQVTQSIHVLVAAAFIGPRPAGMDVRHLDGDKSNNRADNLMYGTRSENNLDAVRHRTNANTSKTQCPFGHPLEIPNLYPRRVKYGHRACRACAQARAAMQRARRRGLAFDMKLASDHAFAKIMVGAD